MERAKSVQLALEQKFREEKEEYKAILEIYNSQINLDLSKGMDGLMELYKEIEKHTSKIKEIEQVMVPLKKEWETLRDRLPVEEKKSLQKEVDEVKSLLVELMAVQKKSEEMLNNENTTIAKDRTNIRQQRAAMEAYNISTSADKPKFYDKKK